MAFATDQWFEKAETGDDPKLSKPGPSPRSIAARDEAKRLRAVIHDRLVSEGEFEYSNKLAGCGLPLPLVCSNCGEHRTTETQCRRRYCPACAWVIKGKRLRRYAGAVRLMRWPLFVTLTAANSSDPECVTAMRGAWSRMRRRKIIADKVVGGIVALEITNTGEGWHPHIHSIVDSEWLAVATPKPHWSDSDDVRKLKYQHAHDELSRMWGQVCGQDAAIVHVRRMVSEEALVYSLAYSIAGTDLADSAEAIGPLLRVMEKTRLVTSFGSLYGRTAEMDDEERPVMCCENCGVEKSILPTALIYSIARIDPEKKLPSMLRRKDFGSPEKNLSDVVGLQIPDVVRPAS